MTGLETVLMVVVSTLGGGVLGKVMIPGVSKSQCKTNHEAISKLFDEKLKSIDQRLERIEDAMNGKNKSQ